MGDHGPLDFGVVGGGLLGLTLAIRLADLGHAVTVYERSPAVGGLASSASLGDVVWDRFYHVTLQSDASLLSLFSRLGLDDDLRWAATGTGLYDDGHLYPVSDVMDYVKLPVLSPLAKARIGGTVLRASVAKDWRALEQITAEEWLTRWSGRGAYEGFWQPLLRAKLGDRHDKVSAAFIWAIIQRLYAARRAGLKQDLFGYVTGGYAHVLDRMVHVAEDLGVDIRCGEAVSGVRSGPSPVVSTSADRAHDRVVITAPSPIAAGLIPELSGDERHAHASIEYQGIVCVSLLLDAELTGFYVTNITDASVPFTGVIEMSALVDRTELGGNHLVYLPSYVPPRHELFEQGDGEIAEAAIAALERMIPSFSADGVVAANVARARYVLPLSTVGYSSRLPDIRTSVDDVFILNTAHILNGTLNANETVDLADGAIAMLTAPSSVGVRP